MGERKEIDIDTLIKQLFNEGAGKEYLEFYNSSGHHFFIPIIDIRKGLMLYHASRIKGKLFKSLLPFIGYFPKRFVRSRVKKVTLQESVLLHKILVEAFGESEPVIAISCGTPGVHQKITLQVSNRKQVLGYCKISDKEEVGALFQEESELLKHLYFQRLEHIPQVLFCQEFSLGITAFIQTAVKKDRPVNGKKDERLIWEFLTELNTKTSGNITFEESDYFRDLQEMKIDMSVYGLKGAALLERSIIEVEDYFRTHITNFSVFHGDLTTWNTYIHQNKLYVFDWEYSKRSFPPFLDFFHFFTQCAFFEWRWNSQKTFREFCLRITKIKKYIPNPSLYYKAYLLYIIKFYMARSKKEPDLELKSGYWIEILAALEDMDSDYESKYVR